ncbi:S9 family peptidase [Catenovulum sp. SM1970]|uniref:S9 family peptidase n=1 Tax=Marinifaba aquimaris TaxID=2741323 RepID=UPI001572C19D|nr:S9 family peptidase [Marinifaba aquimaris]NTS78037.1 S9 family peptidase [Marinifaba aquimaris]
MSFLHKSLISAALLISSQAALASAPEQPTNRFTAERVFDIEYATDPQISPDGKMIAYVRHSMDKITDSDKKQIWLLDSKTGLHLPLLDNAQASWSPRWSPDGEKLLFSTVVDGKVELSLYYFDADRRFSLAQFTTSPSNATWSPDGKHIAFNMFIEGKKPSFATPIAQPKGATWNEAAKVYDDLIFRFDGAGYLPKGNKQVFTLPIEGGTPRQLTHTDVSYDVADWLDNDTLLVTGNPNEDRQLDFIESDIFSIELSDLSLEAMTDRDGPDHSPVVSPNGKYIAYRGYDDKVLSYQQQDLYLMNADGTQKREIAADFKGSIGQVAWAPDNKSLLVLSEDHGDMTIFNISLKGKVKEVISDIGGGSIGRPYANGSFSVSGKKAGKIAYMSASTDRPSEVGTATLSGKKAKVLTQLNADVLPYLDMAKVEEVKVKSSVDGKEIEAWVALPPDFKADGSFPMIMEIHGGPYAMYGPFFGSEMQRFAAEGYVTVWVNPRGSTGYGEDFALEIDLAYPGNDYHDLMSVVDELIARKYVSDERLFVTGGSGGGLLTAWIVTQTDRFAAAVSVKPVINWMTMALSADIASYVKRHWIREEPWSNPDAYLKRSPISYMDKVTTPTMVMVGEEDYRTPTWEAEQFYTALKLINVDTALVRVPGAPHYIASRPSRLITKTDNIMGWFEKYDPVKIKQKAEQKKD